MSACWTIFLIYRSDRSDRIRGGTCIYVHEDIIVTDVSRFDNKYCEALIISILSESTILISFYRPPETPLHLFKECMVFVQNYITQIQDTSQTVMLTGDFNFPNICWEDLEIKAGSSVESNSSAQILLDFMYSNLMSQYITIPTRNNNTLDILITNSPNLVNHVSASKSLLSDHNLITVRFSYTMNKHDSQTNIPTLDSQNFSGLNFTKANFKEIYSYIQAIDWDELKNCCESNDFPELIRLTVLQICCLHTPLKRNSKESC